MGFRIKILLLLALLTVTALATFKKSLYMAGRMGDDMGRHSSQSIERLTGLTEAQIEALR